MHKLLFGIGLLTILTFLPAGRSVGATASGSGDLSHLIRFGVPKVETFYANKTDLRSEVRAIGTLSNGEMAFLTSDQLVVFDGMNWESVNAFSGAMSFVNLDDGSALVASNAGLVQMTKDRYGEYRVEGFENPEAASNGISTLDFVATTAGRHYGLRGTSLVEVDTDSNVKFHRLSSWASTVFGIGDQVFVTGGTSSLLNRWDVETGQLVDNSSVLNDSVYEWFVDVTPRSKGGVWLLTVEGKIVGFDGTRSWLWAGNENLAKMGVQVTSFVEFYPERLAVGSSGSGVILFGENGEVFTQVSAEQGLEDDSVREVGMDLQNGLWVSTNRGLSRVDVGFETLIFDQRQGLPNTTNVVEIFDGRIYVGTDLGLYVSVDDPSESGKAFRFFDEVREVSDLLAFEDHLFIVGSEVKSLDRAGNLTLLSPNGGTCFWKPEKDPDVILLGYYDGVALIERKEGKWRLGENLPGSTLEVFAMTESSDGIIWGSLGNNDIARIQIYDSNRHVEVVPIPTPMNGIWSMAVEIEGDVYLNSVPSLKWNVGEGRFEEVSDFFYYVGAPPYGFEHVYGWSRENAYVCISARRGTTYKRPNGRVIGEISGLGNSFDTRGTCLVLDEDGNAWIGGSFGLMRASNPIEQVEPFEEPARIHKLVSIKTGENLPFSLPDSGNLILEPNQDSIRIEAEFPNFVSSSYNKIRFYVEGLDSDFPEFSDVGFRELTNLDPGDYTIVVNGMDGAGRITPDLEVSLTLKPYWYEKPLAYVGYFIVVVLLIYFIVKRLERRHVEKSRELERLVQERTSEVEKKNFDLEKQAEVLEKQNFELAEKSEELQQTTESLTETLRELQSTQDRLVETARTAGKAEIATSVLHNVGNVLNSVNISLETLSSRVAGSQVSRLKRLADLLESKREDIDRFLTEDARGKAVPEYLIQVASVMNEEIASIAFEISSMEDGVEHIKRIISAQQTHAKSVNVSDEINLTELCDTALTILGDNGFDSSCEIVNDLEKNLLIVCDKHRTLEIVLNLLKNAKDSIVTQNPDIGIISISSEQDLEAGMFLLHIKDNGVGVAPEKASELFQYGFTTKVDGHGFGLHSSANAAVEMGGKLSIASKGIGKGATATLALPHRSSLLGQ